MPSKSFEPLIASWARLDCDLDGAGLLAEDAGHRVPRTWEMIHPYPDPGPKPRRNPRPARVIRNLHTFTRLAPEFPSLHPFSAISPQGCT